MIPPALDVVYNAVSEGMAAAIISLIKYLTGSVSVLRIVEAVKIPAVVAATHEALKRTEYLFTSFKLGIKAYTRTLPVKVTISKPPFTRLPLYS